jgi:hypothetical protein
MALSDDLRKRVVVLGGESRNATARRLQIRFKSAECANYFAACGCDTT